MESTQSGQRSNEYEAILIGCSLVEDSKGVTHARRDENTEKPGANPLRGVIKDLENMERFLRSKSVSKFSIIKPTQN